MSAVILLLDDSATMRAILRTYLARLDCTLVEAASAEEALGMLRARKVDLVVADVWLEGMSGLLFTRELRGTSEWVALPVVLITMEASPGLEEQSRLAGANAFMQKPIQAEALRQVVSSLLPTKA